MTYTNNFRLKKINPGNDSWADEAWSNLEKIDDIGNGFYYPRDAGDKTRIFAYSPNKTKIPGIELRPNEDGTIAISIGRRGDVVTINGTPYGATSSSSVSEWESGKYYSVGSMAYNYGLLFRCEATHVSSTFPQDLGFWVCVSQGAGILPQPPSSLSSFEVIHHNGTNWAKARANDVSTLSEPPTIVVVSSTSHFLYSMVGVVKISNGFTVGQVYFLSETVAGQLTTTEPVTFSNPILKCLSSEAVMILPYRPMEVL